MKPRFYRRRASAVVFCLVAIPLACGNDHRAADDDDDGVGASAGRGGTVGSGGSAGKSSTPSDRCSECDDSTDCSTGFCNRIGSSDFLELIGEPLSPAGACSAPGDVGKCGCFVGYVEGGSLCVGTGCTGTAVTLCDHLSGDEFTGAVGTGGTGGTAGTGPIGRAGGAGRGGSSGTGGNLGADSLGESCDADADCGPNLICLASDALAGSGPARGLCTKPCAADAECRALAAGAYCIGLGSDANYCVEGCLLGAINTPKCRERPELACSLIGAIPGAVSCLDANDCRTGQLCESSTNLCFVSTADPRDFLSARSAFLPRRAAIRTPAMAFASPERTRPKANAPRSARSAPRLPAAAGTARAPPAWGVSSRPCFPAATLRQAMSASAARCATATPIAGSPEPSASTSRAEASRIFGTATAIAAHWMRARRRATRSMTVPTARVAPGRAAKAETAETIRARASSADCERAFAIGPGSERALTPSTSSVPTSLVR
jgi:hypothetical protein